MRLRLVLSAAVLGGLVSFGPDAAAQSDREIVNSLLNRIEDADELLMQSVMDKVKNKRAHRADVLTLFSRGLEYYKKGNHFAAESLLDAGLDFWFIMDWPADESFARARYYHAISLKRFCFDEEAEKCKAYHRDLKTRYLDDAARVYAILRRSGEFPAELQASAKRECLAIVKQLQALCRADTTGIKACNPKSPWRCE